MSNPWSAEQVVSETLAKELARFKAIYTHSVLRVYGYDLQDIALVQSAETSIHLALF